MIRYLEYHFRHLFSEKTMDFINVRFARKDDLEFVSQDEYIPPAVVARKIDIYEVVIAETHNKPVGYLRLEYLWSMVPYISLITVDPANRQRGVGKALLSFVTDFLGSQGHDWLYSSSQADEPEPQAWHRHMGFQDCGIITGINDGVSEIFFRIGIAG
jgi:ribosomal protein S18 acetylase RimI-like enzyme